MRLMGEAGRFLLMLRFAEGDAGLLERNGFVMEPSALPLVGEGARL